MSVDFKILSLGYSSNQVHILQIEKAMETLRRRGGIVVRNTRTLDLYICQHHLEHKYTARTGVLEALALGIFQPKNVDARVLGGPERALETPLFFYR